MEEPNFWDNPEEAQEQMKQLSSMKEDRDTYQKLVSAKEDMETLIEMGQEEDDDSVVPEIAEMMEEFKASFDAIRIKTLLSGEFDKDNAIIKLNAGAGGTEACDWCGMLYRMYTRWAERKGFTIEELDFLDGDLSGKDVLIVEDILDTGVTLSNLVPMLKMRNPNSVKICTILFLARSLHRVVAELSKYASICFKTMPF